MKVLREMAEWPVPLNLKTPVFRLNTRTYYGVRDIARQLGAENEVSCVLSPGADGDVSLIEHLQTRPEALRIILKDPLANSHVPADAPSRSEKGIPCYAGESLEKHADGTFTLKEIQGDGCLTAQIRMELCRQIEQGIDPLGGKSIEECLAAQPVEKVPVFRKKIKI